MMRPPEAALTGVYSSAHFDIPHSISLGRYSRHDLVPEHGGKGAERLHGGAGLVAHARGVGAADPTADHLQNHPLGTWERRGLLLHEAYRAQHAIGRVVRLRSRRRCACGWSPLQWRT